MTPPVRVDPDPVGRAYRKMADLGYRLCALDQYADNPTPLMPAEVQRFREHWERTEAAVLDHTPIGCPDYLDLAAFVLVIEAAGLLCGSGGPDDHARVAAILRAAADEVGLVTPASPRRALTVTRASGTESFVGPVKVMLTTLPKPGYETSSGSALRGLALAVLDALPDSLDGATVRVEVTPRAD